MTTLRTRDQLELELHAWPAAEPKANVVLLHGYFEHGGRYAHVAAGLNAKGLSLYAIDFRGHGRSKGATGAVLRFSDYHHDVEALLAHARQQQPGLPLFLMAHSMGGLVALDWVIASGGRGLAGLVLSSPYLATQVKVNPIKEKAARILSRVWPGLSLKEPLAGNLVCRDETIAAVHDSDPLINKTANARWYTEALAAQERVLARAGEIKQALLLLYAGDDKIVSADTTDRFARLLTMADKSTERLAGAYHEILNEPPAVRERIIARIADWILAHRAMMSVAPDAA